MSCSRNNLRLNLLRLPLLGEIFPETDLACDVPGPSCLGIEARRPWRSGLIKVLVARTRNPHLRIELHHHCILVHLAGDPDALLAVPPLGGCDGDYEGDGGERGWMERMLMDAQRSALSIWLLSGRCIHWHYLPVTEFVPTAKRTTFSMKCCRGMGSGAGDRCRQSGEKNNA